ncbi:MAG: MotA/TolQ/ExbB proton channel family protein [Chitinophagales bacterium]|jgi:biopolymer transport protein ExbB|nr:MotA/TolQ/ExbB proton channel family protein [Saprospirales bacterium]MBK8350201.1 MotA/TolQ/ExbB proton channel family protein [Saprospirales bacterium]MBP6660495.1 MotA/TolQ/ExbB proton channel family protein [Chitinophagales bacterium]
MAQGQTANTVKNGFKLPPIVVIIVALIVAELIFHLVFGAASNFKDATKKEVLPGNYMGLIYHGGFIVPFLLSMFIVLITFSIERFLTINKAHGNGSIEAFLQNIKSKLASHDINGALAECTKQKGSVANVVQAGLQKYAEMEKNTELSGEQKILNIQKEVEESTSLELPALEANLTVISTIATVGTLVALLGTVLGMLRSFSALGQAGATDTSALAQGISEALVNTAIGIATSALAIIMYNFLTSKIDSLTYAIDEIGYSISQSFASSKH